MSYLLERIVEIMSKICVFGAGVYGKRTGEYILQTDDVLVGFLDNDKNKSEVVLWNNEEKKKKNIMFIRYRI